VDDFIFGTLASDAQRLAHVRALGSGITHLNARKPRDPLPGQPIQLELTLGPEHTSDRAWVYWSTDDDDPVGSGGAVSHGNATPMELVDVKWDNLEWGYSKRYRATIPGQPDGTVLRYYLAAEDREGNESPADDGAYYAFYVGDDPTPDWAYEAIIYHIFVDRFFPGEDEEWKHPESPSGFYGGTLRGITQKLDYISGSGANTLWLSPIFPSPSHHGYDATDFFKVEPRLGSEADLRELVEAAHERHIKVMLDFVPNHWSSLHSTFQDALGDPNSPYVEWYKFRNWPEEYESFFDVKNLPQINLRHLEARQHVLQAVEHWLNLGVDGFRLDYAIGPARDFWADFRRTVLSTNPDAWTFGEVVEPPDSQLSFQGLLDGCLDFILLEAIRQTFAFRRWDAKRFMSFLDCHETYFPPSFTRPSFLDNHDMNRYLWVVNGDKRLLKIAALCQFTLAGPPVVYYGTEVGLSQLRDIRQDGKGILEEARLPMLWGKEQDEDLITFYRKLIALRRRESALIKGERRTLHADSDTLAYLRSDGSRSLVTVINLAPEPRQVTLQGNRTTIAVETQDGCELIKQADTVHVKLPAISGIVLVE